MGRKRRRSGTTTNGLILFGVALFAVGALLIIGGQVRVGLFILLSIGTPYLLFFFPFTCNETKVDRDGCTRRRYGWLLGCHDHKWRAMRRLFGQPELPRAPRGGRTVTRAAVTTTTVLAAPAVVGSRWYDATTLLLAVIATIAGVMALFVGPGSW
jgi:hypothetical protein